MITTPPIQQSLPAGMSILHLIAKGLELSGTTIKFNHPDFAAAKTILTAPKHLYDNPDFLTNVPLVTFYQTTVLATLSMHNGIFIPDINTVSQSDNTIHITWKTGIKDTFTWGLYDEAMARFEKSVNQKVMGYQEANEGNAIVRLTHYLEHILLYSINLDVCKKRIDILITNPQKAPLIFKEDLSADLIFILFACFPIDTMNQLFAYIYQFFPEDLNVKTQDGNTVNVERLFQSPSSDIQYLIKKVMIYHDLYFSSSLPIIKEITRSKTTTFLLKLIANPKAYNETKQQLTALRDQQISLRVTLYQLVASRIEKLIT